MKGKISTTGSISNADVGEITRVLTEIICLLHITDWMWELHSEHDGYSSQHTHYISADA